MFVRRLRHTARPSQVSPCQLPGGLGLAASTSPCLPGDRFPPPVPGELGRACCGGEGTPLSLVRPLTPLCNFSFKEDSIPYLRPTTTNPFAGPDPGES